LTNGQDTWRARYAETHTPGSEGGPGKRTGSNTGTALGAYLTLPKGYHTAARGQSYTMLLPVASRAAPVLTVVPDDDVGVAVRH
jgi:hypothetical protein